MVFLPYGCRIRLVREEPAEMLQIENVKINHLINPVGVVCPLSLSWNLLSDEKNMVQAEYEITVSLRPDFCSPCLKIQKTGSESAEIPLEIDGLRECTEYFVSVKVSA